MNCNSNRVFPNFFNWSLWKLYFTFIYFDTSSSKCIRDFSCANRAPNIKALKLKGSVHQQTGALDEFQKEDLKKGDARVLLLLSRDESASGANLTTANHAIFVHPLLTTTQYEYEASETQAIGRIRRYGQTKTVKIWRMIIRDSIDAEIIEQRAAVTAVEK